MSKLRSKNAKRRKRISRRKRAVSKTRKIVKFVAHPAGGAFLVKKGKSRGLYVFDSISFMATDVNQKCFETNGLLFDCENGWYEAGADFPKYYGKDVHAACIDYAVDRAVRDSLCLSLAIFGKKRPAEYVLRLDRSDVIKEMENRGYVTCPMDEQLQGQIVFKQENVA